VPAKVALPSRSSVARGMPRFAAMLTILVPLLVCVLGALVHLASTSPKLARLGTLGAYAFLAGLLWTLAEVSHRVLHVG
jgi:hypothetical protein